MQLYQRDAIESAVSIDTAALEAVENAFAALGRDDVVQPPILSMAIEESNGEVDVKTAHIRGGERFAIKVSPGFFDNPKIGLPSLNGLMMVFSAKTGLVDAVLFDEGYLTAVRTALAGALASKYLSREDSRRVAVLGIKPETRADQPGHYVPAYLQGAGVEVVPVPLYYPDVKEILGVPVIRDLRAVPGPVDVLDVFCKPENIPQHLEDILALRPQAVWLQSGIRSPAVETRLVEAGIDVVADRCLLVDHQNAVARL